MGVWGMFGLRTFVATEDNLFDKGFPALQFVDGTLSALDFPVHFALGVFIRPYGRERPLQPFENKALSRGIIGKSAPILAEITIRKRYRAVYGRHLAASLMLAAAEDTRMPTIQIELPDEVLLSLKETPEGLAKMIRMAAAAKLYELGKLSSGRAADLAGLPRVSFLQALGQYGVPIFALTEEELAQDLRNA